MNQTAIMDLMKFDNDLRILPVLSIFWRKIATINYTVALIIIE